MFFFFQAEDGIRDLIVTGVQTCALPISAARRPDRPCRGSERRHAASTGPPPARPGRAPARHPRARDRKSTRLNSSHDQISYAVFCLKKKKHFKVHAASHMLRSPTSAEPA